jgi:hypothetical protein
VLPPAIAEAFGTLTAPNAPRLVDVWAGIRPAGNGRMRVTLAWTPRTTASDPAVPASVAATVAAADQAPFETNIDAEGTTVEVPTGRLQLAIRVLDARGEVLDREKRTVDPPTAAEAPLGLSTPVLYRSRSPLELRAIVSSDTPPVHAGRAFSRTDRLIIRTLPFGPAAGSAKITAKLIDRRGAVLVSLPVQRAPAGDGYQLDLPLASIAAGEFAVVLDATSGDARAEALVAFRVVR